jgi:predicted homoserine dehydrogenase-like protein
MVIVDRELERREQEGRPVRVGLVGAGYMARGIALQILTAMKGMRLVAVSNRNVENATRCYRDAGVDSIQNVDSTSVLEDAVRRGRPAVTDDAQLLCKAEGIDAIIDATGEYEFGAHVAVDAIKNGKHLILMNAELDAAVGPILKVRADRAGIVYTYTDGDEPGVAMNLYRFVKTIGYKPVAMGQIKGFLDRYRNPDTQAGFAAKHKQKAAMVSSFADGSKLSLESTIMANATGFRPGVRGMYGFQCAHVKELLTRLPSDQLMSGGLVDFALGAEPHTGAFVIGYDEHPIKRQYMSYFKMGDGPLYMFYTPYHLPHLQLPLTVARAALFGDATLAPLGAPVCDTGAFAKRDLKAGEILDGMGGFTCYGLIDTIEVARTENLLPMSLAQGCRLKRNIRKDQSVTYADVELPPGRLCDQLRSEQENHFFGNGAQVKDASSGSIRSPGKPGAEGRIRPGESQ